MLYSIFYYHGDQSDLDLDILKEIAFHYQAGTKIYGVFATKEQVFAVVSALDEVLEKKNLQREGENLLAHRSEVSKISMVENHFLMFHGSFHVTTLPCPVGQFLVKDGDIGPCLSLMEEISAGSTFDLSQFQGEHGAIGQNIYLEGMAGTGKSRTLCQRLLFLYSKRETEGDSLETRYEMVFFSDYTKENTKKYLQTYLQQYELLTEKHELVDLFQRYTQLFSMEEFILFHCPPPSPGKEWEIVEDDQVLHEIIGKTTEIFLFQEENQRDLMLKYGITFAEVEEFLFLLVQELFKLRVPIEQVSPLVFGKVHPQDEFGFIKTFWHESAIEVAKLWKNSLISQGKIHKRHLCSHFLQLDGQVLQEGKKKYFLLVDDMSLAEVAEEKVLLFWGNQQNINLFLTKNSKEFGEEFKKEAFFRHFHPLHQESPWKFICLKHQYRSDYFLWKLLLPHFSLGQGESSDRLFPNEAHFFSHSNDYLKNYPEKYFGSVKIYGENQRMVAIYDEIMRFKRRLTYEAKQGGFLHDGDSSIGILVQNYDQKEKVEQFFRKYDMPLETEQTTALADFNRLLAYLLDEKDAVKVYELLKTEFFHEKISKSEIYHFSESISNLSVLAHQEAILNFLEDYMQQNLNAQDFMLSYDSMQDFREKSMGSFGKEQLRKFYYLMKPWLNYSENQSEQEKYKEEIKEIFDFIDEKEMNTLSEMVKCRYPVKKVYAKDGFLGEKKCPVFCYTVDECAGMEFGAVILPFCGENKDNQDSIQRKSDFISYSYKIGRKKNMVKNEYFIEKPLNSEEKQSLYLALTRSRSSCTWFSQSDSQGETWQCWLEEGSG